MNAHHHAASCRLAPHPTPPPSLQFCGLVKWWLRPSFWADLNLNLHHVQPPLSLTSRARLTLHLRPPCHSRICPCLSPQQVLAMLLLVFVATAALSAVFLSLTITFACATCIPPRMLAFTLLAVGAEAPDCIVNFIASK